MRSIWHSRRINGNIQALEIFEGILDDIDLKGAAPLLGFSQGEPDHLPGRGHQRSFGRGVRGQRVYWGH